jgi:hypothetical protein
MKKILIIFASALVVAVLTLPMSTAFAKKPERIPITGIGGMPQGGGYSAPYIWKSGNIQHGRGATGIFPMWMITWDQDWDFSMLPVFPDPTETLRGTATQIWDYNVNMETGKGVAHIWTEIVLGAGTSTDPSDDGTFEGTYTAVGEFHLFGPNLEYAYPDNVKSYGVLRGTGAYQGWKITIENEANVIFKR